MAKTTYYEKLKHPLWQRRRLERLQAGDYTCRECGATDKELHVHHTLYRRGANPWEYSDDELVVLCGDCHEAAERLREHMLVRFGTLPHRVQQLLINAASWSYTDGFDEEYGLFWEREFCRLEVMIDELVDEIEEHWGEQFYKFYGFWSLYEHVEVKLIARRFFGLIDKTTLCEIVESSFHVIADPRTRDKNRLDLINLDNALRVKEFESACQRALDKNKESGLQRRLPVTTGE